MFGSNRVKSDWDPVLSGVPEHRPWTIVVLVVQKIRFVKSELVKTR